VKQVLLSEHCRLSSILIAEMKSPVTYKLFVITCIIPIQVAGAVLRDSSGCDALADQVLSSLSTRQSEGVNEDALGGGERDEVGNLYVCTCACFSGVE
jgi:hypothetical protein